MNRPWVNGSHQQGATLVEVLIAGLVVGVGLLGIAALQLNALRNSSDAQFRGIASDLAWSLADRMRANIRGFAEGGYSAGSGVSCGGAPTSCAMHPGGSAITEADGCSLADMAAYDLYEVACSDNGAATLLPGGTVAVQCVGVCAQGATVNITVSWTTREDFDGSGAMSDSLTMQVLPGFDPLR